MLGTILKALSQWDQVPVCTAKCDHAICRVNTIFIDLFIFFFCYLTVHYFIKDSVLSTLS